MRILFVMALLFSLPAFAQSKPMQLELAEARVDITTGFNGTNVVLFGTTMEENPQMAITLKGPERTMVVRRKERALGAWMNRSSVEFRRVPSYYDYISTMNDEALNEFPKMMDDAQIGVDHLGIYPENAKMDAEIVETFKDALIQRLQRKGFYPIKAGTLTYLNPRFFKASFDLPPGVPTGIYTVEAILIKDGVATARELKTFQVGQVGFNARVYSFADDHSFFYGIFAVMMALVSGWGAFTFLRRD